MMSRALNIDATMDHVVATCAKHSAPISAIETLPGGCTRVVLCNADAAATIRRKYGNSVIVADVARTPRSVAPSTTTSPTHHQPRDGAGFGARPR